MPTSCAGLNARGETDIIAVDNLARADKFRNLVDCEIADYLDKEEFLARLSAGDFDDDVTAILHQGACSDTMETDGRYMMRNNYRYSATLLDHCQNNDIPFLYASSASVYGGGATFVERREHEAPLNVYGYSKFLFDQYVRRVLPERTAPIVGFRYFNVYGPREQHKGRMASVAFHFFHQYRKNGRVRLFEGSGGYAAGEQRRDFVAVSDVVAANLDFLGHGDRSGIFNLGSGRAESVQRRRDDTWSTRAARPQARPRCRWPSSCARAPSNTCQFPPQLVGKYQSFTQADLDGAARRGIQGADDRARDRRRGLRRMADGARRSPGRNVSRTPPWRVSRGGASTHVRRFIMTRLIWALALALAACFRGSRHRRRSTSTRPPRTSSSRCPASGPPRRRRSSTTASSTAPSSRSTTFRNVKGIGAKRLEKLRAEVTVAPAQAKVADAAGRRAVPRQGRVGQGRSARGRRGQAREVNEDASKE